MIQFKNIEFTFVSLSEFKKINLKPCLKSFLTKFVSNRYSSNQACEIKQKMDNLTVYNRLPEGVLQRLANKFVWGPQELPVFGAEFRNVNVDSVREPKTFLLTYGALYVFKFKSNGHVILEGQFNLLDLSIITYIQPSSLGLAIGNSNISITKDNAVTDFLERILYMYGSYYYGNSKMMQRIKINSEPEGAIPKIDLGSRPKNLLQLRMIAFAHRDNTKFAFQCLTLVKNWDERPTPNLIIPQNFTAGFAVSAISEAIAVDNCVKNLTLDNFAPLQLDVVLKSIFEFSQTITKINLENYVESPAHQFVLSATYKSKINDLRFHNCNPVIILSVLEGLYSFEGEIRNLSISRCKLSAQHFIKIYECINKLPCMMGLCNFKIEEGTADSIDIKEFSNFLSTIYIKALTITRTFIDISKICCSIFPRTNGLKQLVLSTGRMFESIPSDLELPQSLNYIDISKSQINNETFGSFLKVVFGKPRKHLIALNLSELATSSSMDDIIKCFDIKNPEPILSELNFFGNNLSPDNALNLFKFLRTQKHFQYLNISRCFNTDIPESLSHLSNYINESKLKCLELSCSTNNPLKEHTEKFFQDLTGKCQLSTITMERTQMGDKGLLALLELIKADKYISSISIDGALPETPEVFEKVYNSFISLERLASPKVDFTKHKKSVNLSRDLGKKQNPKNLVSRLNEYDLIELNSSPSIVDKLIDFTKSISDHKKSKHKRNYEEIINVINETIKLTNFPLQGNESSNPFIDNYLLKKHSSKSK